MVLHVTTALISLLQAVELGQDVLQGLPAFSLVSLSSNQSKGITMLTKKLTNHSSPAHIGEDIKTTTVRHPHDHTLHTELGRPVDHL